MPFTSISSAHITWTEEGFPYSVAFDDVYFAGEGLAETRYVFLEGNRLAERFSALPENAHFTIAETGFGTGLNILAAWKLWEETAPKSARLSLVSIEKHPLTREDLARAYQNWPELAAFSQILLSHYPLLVSGYHRHHLNDRVTLTLCFGDIVDVLPELHAQVDAWFFDGFTPAKNPQMWEETLFPHIARLTNEAGTFSSFTAAGFVRRALQAQGFEVTRKKGFGRKWQMLVGKFDASGRTRTGTYTKSEKPWYFPPSSHCETKRAIIIGGGLAGTGAAYALGRRGWDITLIERHPELARESSSNPQGIYMPLLPHRSMAEDPIGHSTLAAFLYAHHHFDAFPHVLREACGVLEVEESESSLPDVAYPVDAKEASELAGVTLAQGGIFYPNAGWIAPRELCKAQVEAYADRIRLILHTEALSLVRGDGEWKVRAENGKLIASAPVVVLAQGEEVTRLAETSWVPLRVIRGQLDQFPQTALSRGLKTVLSQDGQILPAHEGTHWVGASFHPDNRNSTPTHEDTEENQNRFSSLGGKAESIGQKVGFRVATQDKLPVIGAVPESEFYLHAYVGHHEGGAKGGSALYPVAHYQPGLYISTAYGARGITTTPLASEYLAALIEGEPLPLPKNLVDALHPGRFLMRTLRRGK
ncbi:MAG: FAD-dependent cmnm(5)s(2)U34 oxidoreductase [Rickettsiales bacterium]|jgi:tRNA 5-methylaminomethyl-2-thiouridine biosynthesis bifunctional protein|nr:FAD-dependent cmnm(5)s(2)U34 oxidoreductase [Rickettsiales bacterium]